MGLVRCCGAGLVTMLLAGSMACAKAQSRSYAVVVGIDTYASAHWRHLSYAEADASAVAAILRSQGYEVTELRPPHATKQDILEALYKVGGELKATDSFLFFFAGHGASERVGSETWGYVVPSDGTGAASYISNDDLQSVSRRLNVARHQLFIIDACYSGLMVTRSGGVDPNVPNYIDEVTARTSREALSAGGANQEVLDVGGDGHSVFTRALMDGLAGAADLNGDGFITYPELQAYITPRASNAFQTPAGGVFAGHAGGEFVFASPKGRTAALKGSAPVAKLAARRGGGVELADVAAVVVIRALPTGAPDPLEGPKKLLLEGSFDQASVALRASAGAGNAEAMFLVGLLYHKGWGTAQDDTQAREWYGKAARAGNAASMEKLGLLFQTTHGGPQDYALARQWLEAGAKAGDAGAINELGLIYAKGLGVPVDYVKARAQFEQAAALSFPNGFTNMGMLYAHGYGVPQNREQARQWYEKAAAAGSPEGMNNLGTMYNNGHDYPQARFWWERAAAAGNGAAMGNLGYMYAIGRGVAQSYDTAKLWLEKGSALGDEESIRNLAALDGDGFGTVVSPEARLEHLKEQADAGTVEAMVDLAESYEREGTLKHSTEIRRLLLNAATAGSFVAMYELGETYREVGYGKPDYAQARQWFEKAAAGGDLQAIYHLAGMYYDGEGVAVDYHQARQLYEKGVTAGDIGCMRQLSHMYQEGIGVTRNTGRAKQLSDQADALNAQP